MTEKQIQLAIGSMLHDIGKVAYRSGDGRNHSKSGYDYLKGEAGIQDQEILNCVRFHHGVNLKGAPVAADSLAFITYFADNVAAAADRRERQQPEDGFDKAAPLASIFNLLNGNDGHSHYARQVLNPKTEMAYPTEEPVAMDGGFYSKIIRDISGHLKGIRYSEEYLNSLLSILEANLSYIPSSTSKRELADISLYDHIKMTAAVALCIEQYLAEQGIKDYKRQLFEKPGNIYGEKMFLLYSMDISGIQSFIYTVGSKGALRGLRARSFYLELVMEHMIDELLARLCLCRINLIYSGGGHCYLLVPNTEAVRLSIDEQEHLVNRWLLDTFGIALYVAGGYVPCSAKDLRNDPKGSYAELYQTISRIISGKKSHRYNAEEICRLNEKVNKGERECSVCRKMDQVDEEGRCLICAGLERMSSSILHQEFFTVINRPEDGALPLPGGKYLIADSQKQLIKRMESQAYVRSYTKNDSYTGKHVATRLWVGDYTTGDTFDTFAENARGIRRLGILRADVDNLGAAFVYGFRRPDGDERYVTISRTASLSRQLSLFFKGYINGILSNGESDYLSGGGKRNVAIVYSGGDDVFLVGAWNEVVDAFVDLRKALQRFTQGTLTLSGGVGIYPSGYPINVMAREVAQLESQAKGHEGKNAITIFGEMGMFGWDCFVKDVLGEKLQTIKDFFCLSEERGKTFLYHLLELMQREEERINTARYVYLLSRMEPDTNSEKAQKEAYRHFVVKMYEWIRTPKERRKVLMAMYLYVYLTRDREEME